ncbi:MAG: AsmA-like C-terminal domain-containing protein [Candidatus Omnitrophota bacterium]|jgi:hypothetical protein
MIRKPILILVIIVMIAFGVFYYINNFFLPIQFREIVYETAKKSLKREINFSHIYYQPLKGFIVKDFVIFRKDDPNLPFVHIKEAQFKILFAPLLQRQQIIIPALLIKQPFVHIIRHPGGLWNFSDLLQAKMTTEKSPFPVLLGRIQISGGQAEIADLQTDPNIKIVANNIKADCRLSLSKGIDFQLKSELATPSSTISLRGRFNPAQKSWQTNVTTANIDTLPFLKIFIHTKNLRTAQATIATADLNVSGAMGQPWQFTGSLAGDLDIGIHNKGIKGKLALQNADLKYDGQTLNYHGGVILDKAEISYDDLKIVQGNISLAAKPLIYSLGEDDLVIKGNLKLTPGYLNPSDQVSVSFGSIQLNDFHYQQELYTNILTGEVSASKVNFLASDITFNTDSLSSPVVFSRKGQSAEVTFSPSLQSVSVQSKQKKISADTMQFKMSVLQIVDRDFSLSTTIESNSLKAALVDEDDDLQFTGDPQIKLTVQYFPSDLQPWVCVGKAHLDKASLSGLPRSGPLTNINGDIEFTSNRMKTSNLSLEAQGTLLSLSGSLSNFSNPFVGVVISAKDFDLDLLKIFFKQQLDNLNIIPKGTAAVEVSFTGPTSLPEEAQIEVNAHLKDAQVQSPRWPEPATGISGFLRYKDDTLRWTDLNVTYLKTPFTLNGELSQFDRPLLSTIITAPDLQASLKLNINNEAIGIDTFAGTYYQSKFNINGQAFLKEAAPAHLSLKTAFSLNLKDLERLNPKLREKITSMALKGTISGKALFDGDISNWTAGVTDLNVSGTDCSLGGITFNRCNLIVQRTRSTQSKLNFFGTLYGGDMAITSLFDISEAARPGKFSVTLNNIDLAQLTQNPRWEKLKLAGILSSQLQAEGPLLETEKITGQGSLAIINGQLWTLSFLKGLGKLLFIPEMENVVFTEGSADFTIKNNQLSTENLLLQSKQMELRGKGWIDKNKNISWDIVPKLYETEILQSDSLKKIPTALISQTDGYINIKIRGTMDNPVRTVENFPAKLLKKTAEGILEGVQGIFEEILQ